MSDFTAPPPPSQPRPLMGLVFNKFGNLSVYEIWNTHNFTQYLKLAIFDFFLEDPSWKMRWLIFTVYRDMYLKATYFSPDWFHLGA